jgi:hypothetical protein
MSLSVTTCHSPTNSCSGEAVSIVVRGLKLKDGRDDKSSSFCLDGAGLSSAMNNADYALDYKRTDLPSCN